MSELQSEARSVKSINQMLNALIISAYDGEHFWIEGEVSNCIQSTANHIYFDLGDKKHAISCALFRGYQKDLQVALEDRMIVKVNGKLELYVKNAKVQIIVQDVVVIKKPQKLSLEAQRSILRKRGIDPERRRKLPNKVNKIAIITGHNSAALKDFEAPYRRDGGKASITPCFVPLQGKNSVQSIVETIQNLNQKRSFDAIVLARGGGKASHISTFDDLDIAEAICRSDIHITTAIGHQENRTIADEFADENANTPSDASTILLKAQNQRAATNTANWVIIGMATIILLLIFLIIYQNL